MNVLVASASVLKNSGSSSGSKPPLLSSVLGSSSFAASSSSSSDDGIDWEQWMWCYSVLASLDLAFFVVVLARFVHLLVLRCRVRRGAANALDLAEDLRTKLVFFGAVAAALVSGTVNYIGLVCTSTHHDDPRHVQGSRLVVSSQNLTDTLSLLMYTCVLVLWTKLLALWAKQLHHTGTGMTAGGTALEACCARTPPGLVRATNTASLGLFGATVIMSAVCTAVYGAARSELVQNRSTFVLQLYLGSGFAVCGAALVAAGVLLACLLAQSEAWRENRIKVVHPAVALPAALLLMARGVYGLVHTTRGDSRLDVPAWNFLLYSLVFEFLPSVLFVVLMWPVSQRVSDEQMQLIGSNGNGIGSGSSIGGSDSGIEGSSSVAEGSGIGSSISSGMVSSGLDELPEKLGSGFGHGREQPDLSGIMERYHSASLATTPRRNYY